MAIDALLRANIDTHWYAVDQNGQLEAVAKDNCLMRACKSFLWRIGGRDLYAHIRYEKIVEVVFAAVQNEQNGAVVGKYLKLLTKIREKLHSFQIPDELEKSIVHKLRQLVPIKTDVDIDITNIEQCVQEVLRKEREAQFFHSQQNHAVFATEAYRDVIFKLRINERINENFDVSIAQRLKNIEKARWVRKEYGLTELKIPKAGVVTIRLSGDTREVLIERKLCLSTIGYDTLPKTLRNKMARQLTIIGLKTGASDMVDRNLPLVECTKGSATKLKVGLIDLEEMNSIYIGLFGWLGRKGLVHLLPDERDSILEEIGKHVSVDTECISFENEYDDFPKSKPRLIELANELYRRITLKKKLDSLIDGQQLVGEFFVDVNEEGPFYKTDECNLDARGWRCSSVVYDDGTFIGAVINKFKELGLIKGAVSKGGHGWLLEF